MHGSLSSFPPYGAPPNSGTTNGVISTQNNTQTVRHHDIYRSDPTGVGQTRPDGYGGAVPSSTTALPLSHSSQSVALLPSPSASSPPMSRPPSATQLSHPQNAVPAQRMTSPTSTPTTPMQSWAAPPANTVDLNNVQAARSLAQTQAMPRNSNEASSSNPIQAYPPSVVSLRPSSAGQLPSSATALPPQAFQNQVVHTSSHLPPQANMSPSVYPPAQTPSHFHQHGPFPPNQHPTQHHKIGPPVYRLPQHVQTTQSPIVPQSPAWPTQPDRARYYPEIMACSAPMQDAFASVTNNIADRFARQAQIFQAEREKLLLDVRQAKANEATASHASQLKIQQLREEISRVKQVAEDQTKSFQARWDAATATFKEDRNELHKVKEALVQMNVENIRLVKEKQSLETGVINLRDSLAEKEGSSTNPIDITEPSQAQPIPIPRETSTIAIQTDTQEPLPLPLPLSSTPSRHASALPPSQSSSALHLRVKAENEDRPATLSLRGTPTPSPQYRVTFNPEISDTSTQPSPPSHDTDPYITIRNLEEKISRLTSELEYARADSQAGQDSIGLVSILKNKSDRLKKRCEELQQKIEQITQEHGAQLETVRAQAEKVVEERFGADMKLQLSEAIKEKQRHSSTRPETTTGVAVSTQTDLLPSEKEVELESALNESNTQLLELQLEQGLLNDKVDEAESKRKAAEDRAEKIQLESAKLKAQLAQAIQRSAQRRAASTSAASPTAQASISPTPPRTPVTPAPTATKSTDSSEESTSAGKPPGSSSTNGHRHSTPTLTASRSSTEERGVYATPKSSSRPVVLRPSHRSGHPFPFKRREVATPALAGDGSMKDRQASASVERPRAEASVTSRPNSVSTNANPGLTSTATQRPPSRPPKNVSTTPAGSPVKTSSGVVTHDVTLLSRMENPIKARRNISTPDFDGKPGVLRPATPQDLNRSPSRNVFKPVHPSHRAQFTNDDTTAIIKKPASQAAHNQNQADAAKKTPTDYSLPNQPPHMLPARGTVSPSITRPVGHGGQNSGSLPRKSSVDFPLRLQISSPSSPTKHSDPRHSAKRARSPSASEAGKRVEKRARSRSPTR